MCRRFCILTMMVVSLLQAQIPTNGLSVYYPFSGTVRDTSGNGRDCAVNGATFTADRFRKSLSALHFDGTTNYVLVGNILDSVFCAPVAKFTIAGWANTESLPGYFGGDAIIAKAAGGTYGPFQWVVSHDIDGKLKASVFTKADASAFLERQSTVLALGRWFHFALVFDGSAAETERVQLYANNQAGVVSRKVGTLGTGAEKTDQWITIGGTHHASNPLYPGNLYRGSVDDVRIYGRALNPSEIDQLFHEGNWPAVSVERAGIKPNGFALRPNYPNPFNPATRIRFEVPERSSVRLTVFNLLGEIVYDLSNETREAGYFEQTFDASQLPSGIYVCRMTAISDQKPGDTFVASIKMVMVK